MNGKLRVFLWILGLWLEVVVTRQVINHPYAVMAKEIAGKKSAAEVAFERCVVSRHQKFLEMDRMEIRECLKGESAKSPFSVWCNGVDFHRSDVLEAYPPTRKQVADKDGVHIAKFEHLGQVVLYARKTVKYQFADEEVEVDFEFVVDAPK